MHTKCFAQRLGPNTCLYGWLSSLVFSLLTRDTSRMRSTELGLPIRSPPRALLLAERGWPSSAASEPDSHADGEQVTVQGCRKREISEHPRLIPGLSTSPLQKGMTPWGHLVGTRGWAIGGRDLRGPLEQLPAQARVLVHRHTKWLLRP